MNEQQDSKSFEDSLKRELDKANDDLQADPGNEYLHLRRVYAFHNLVCYWQGQCNGFAEALESNRMYEAALSVRSIGLRSYLLAQGKAGTR